MNLRRITLGLVPVTALAAAALLWKPAEAQPRMPPNAVVVPPTLAPFTYDKSIKQGFQTNCTVTDVQYWEAHVTAGLQCRGGTYAGQNYPGGVAYVVLPDVNSVNIALALWSTGRTTYWTCWHNPGDEAYRLQGIGN